MKGAVVADATNRDPNTLFKHSGSTTRHVLGEKTKEIIVNTLLGTVQNQVRSRLTLSKYSVSWPPFGPLGVVYELGSGVFSLHRFLVGPWSLGGMLLPDIQSAAAAAPSSRCGIGPAASVSWHDCTPSNVPQANCLIALRWCAKSSRVA